METQKVQLETPPTAPAELSEERPPGRWWKERAKARQAGAHFKIVLERVTGINSHPHIEYFFRTVAGAESFLGNELHGKGEITDL
jgi:hypothetical protein